MAKAKDDPIMKKIRALYKGSALSLHELGLRMGYTAENARQAAFQFMKSNDPRVSMIRRVAEAFGVELEVLIGEKTRAADILIQAEKLAEQERKTAVNLAVHGPVPLHRVTDGIPNLDKIMSYMKAVGKSVTIKAIAQNTLIPEATVRHIIHVRCKNMFSQVKVIGKEAYWQLVEHDEVPEQPK